MNNTTLSPSSFLLSPSPTFSIIIPVYNVAPYLRECLDSVLAQTFTDWEAICVDDGSTDGSGDILDEYAAKDSRFRVLHQVNAGVSAARNAALDVAQGEWIDFIDGDDVVYRDLLSFLVKCIEETSPDVIRLSFSPFENATDIKKLVPKDLSFRVIEGDQMLDWCWRWLILHGETWVNVIRRSIIAIEHKVAFPIGVHFQEDTLFGIQWLDFASRMCMTDYEGYYYRQRKGSACNALIPSRSYAVFLQNLLAFWANHKRKVVDKARERIQRGVALAVEFDLEWFRTNHRLEYGFSAFDLWMAVCALYCKGAFGLWCYDRKKRMQILFYLLTGTFFGRWLNDVALRFYAFCLRTIR